MKYCIVREEKEHIAHLPDLHPHLCITSLPCCRILPKSGRTADCLRTSKHSNSINPNVSSQPQIHRTAQTEEARPAKGRLRRTTPGRKFETKLKSLASEPVVIWSCGLRSPEQPRLPYHLDDNIWCQNNCHPTFSHQRHMSLRIYECEYI